MAATVENKAIAMAKRAHAAFKAGDIEGVKACWSDEIVHKSFGTTTSDEPFMGVFKGVDEGLKMVGEFGALQPSFSFTDSMFIPVSDTKCIQCVEATLSNGAVLHELMVWTVNADGNKMVEWDLYGDPLSYKKAKNGESVSHEYFYPRHQTPPAAHDAGALTAKGAAKLCHDAFAVGDVPAITGIWHPNIIHAAVGPATPEIPHSGVSVGADAGLAWLAKYAAAGIQYAWVEETTIEVNPNLCFTFSATSYPDGTSGIEAMRWITTPDGKLVSWTCFGNTIKHAAGAKAATSEAEAVVMGIMQGWGEGKYASTNPDKLKNAEAFFAAEAVTDGTGESIAPCDPPSPSLPPSLSFPLPSLPLLSSCN